MGWITVTSVGDVCVSTLTPALSSPLCLIPPPCVTPPRAAEATSARVGVAFKTAPLLREEVLFLEFRLLVASKRRSEVGSGGLCLEVL